MLYIVIHTKDHPNGELRGDSFVGMGGGRIVSNIRNASSSRLAFSSQIIYCLYHYFDYYIPFNFFFFLLVRLISAKKESDSSIRHYKISLAMNLINYNY